MDPCHVGTPCIDMIQLNTVESAVYERRDKLDDQKHVFYKFMDQTDRRVQVLWLAVYLPQNKAFKPILCMSVWYQYMREFLI